MSSIFLDNLKVWGWYATDMKNEFNIQTGLAIRRAREKAKLTQEELSELLDCSPQYISMLENGRYGVSTKMLRELCKSLSVSSDSILFPGSDGHTLEVFNSRCHALSDEKYQLLTEIISRTIDALEL